jgi:hypothetical protein
MCAEVMAHMLGGEAAADDVALLLVRRERA